MPESDGTIYSFQQRRQIEEDVAGLAAATSQTVMLQGVRRMAERYPAPLLLAAVIRHLGTTSSQLRGGLGELCVLLPEEETLAALLAVAGNRSKSPQERTAAALILERNLEAPPPPHLLADLAGVDEVPYQSLLEAVEEGRTNRHVLLEYVTQMQEHPVDTAFMVQRLIDRLDPGDRADLLRLIAQDPRPQVAHAALERLGAAAGEPHGEACLRALHTLVYALPPDHAALAERLLRKLQFGGKRYAPPPAASWQALLAPSDASGYSSVWFVRYATEEPLGGAEEESVAGDSAPGNSAAGNSAAEENAGEDTGNTGIWLGFILSVQGGILQFSGSEDMPREYLPQPVAAGELVTVRGVNKEGTVLLAAPFDVGRWLLRRALEAHWRQPDPQPLPAEYTLYNDLLWQFAPPQLSAELSDWWARSDPAAASSSPSATAVAEAAGILADDPVLEGWLRWSKALWNSVKYRSQQQPAVPATTLVSLLLRELMRMPDHHALLQAMVAGLRLQTLWYAVAGSPAHAARTALLAQAMGTLPITENALVARLLEKGLAQQG
jgi:hypothetical protein